MNELVTITDKAKQRIEKIMRDENYDPSYFVRVAVESGGCSGLSYNLSFDNEEKRRPVLRRQEYQNLFRHKVLSLFGRNRVRLF